MKLIKAITPKPNREKKDAEPEAREQPAKVAASKSQKPKDGRRHENKIVRYFRLTWSELKKTNWPTRQEAVRLTGIVLGVTVAMSAMLGLIDWFFAWLFSFIVQAVG